MFSNATSNQLRAIFEGGDCPSHLFSDLVKESMNREEFVNYEMFKKATNEQLWVIAKHDKNCPSHLLIGVINELIRRDEIKRYICAIIIKLFKSFNAAESFTFMSKEDLIQIGYVGAIESLLEYKQGHGSYANYLYFVLMNKFKEITRDLMADKRKVISHTFSYQQPIQMDETETFEIFFPDKRINIENEVIKKIMLEEKYKLLTPKQKIVFVQYLKGYTVQEIADELDCHKSTAHKQLKKAIIKMAGRNINLIELGVFERVSFKNTKEYSA